MCFTPAISLATAIIEWSLAAFLLVGFRKSVLKYFFAVFIFLLGFYQFTEFMLCSLSNPVLWATLGFVAYSFLPAIGLHGVLKYLKKEPPVLLLYTVPVIASLLALATPFVRSAACERYFVLVQTAFHGATAMQNILFYLYLFYYAGFILLSCYIMAEDLHKQKNLLKRKIEYVELAGIALMTVPTLLLIIMFPYLGMRFPSVLCQFAIFVAIAAFFGVYWDDKLRKRRP